MTVAFAISFSQIKILQLIKAKAGGKKYQIGEDKIGEDKFGKINLLEGFSIRSRQPFQ